MNLDSQKRRRVLRTQVRDVVRAQILDAAEELIAAKGLHGAALAQIAKRAGVAVGTLYNYFKDRDDLIAALFESRRATLRPALLAAGAHPAGAPFEDRLRAFVRAVLAAFESHRSFVTVALANEHVKPAGSTTATDLRKIIDDLVAAGVRERVLHKAHADLTAALLGGAIRAVLVRRSADGKSYVDDSDVLVDYFLDGARIRRE